MSFLRFENSGQARNFVEDKVEEKIKEEHYHLSDEVVALATFKSNKAFDEAYFVDLNVLDNCLEILTKNFNKEIA